MKKIGFYDSNKNTFVEIARWRNSNNNMGANFGLLQLWTPLYCAAFYDKQKNNNLAGNYNKPTANLESCLWQFKKAIEKKEIVSENTINYSDCGSIDSLIRELKDYLQYMYKEKLFIIDIF
jgi:hypothetical protein